MIRSTINKIMPFIKVYNKKKEVYTPHQTFELFLFVSVEGSGHMKFCLKSPKKMIFWCLPQKIMNPTGSKF